MSFSLYLQPRINIIESKFKSSKKRTSERNAEYKGSDAERQSRFNWSHVVQNRQVALGEDKQRANII